MSLRQVSWGLAAVLAMATGVAQAQETTAGPDSAAIHTTLRAFYFNLAHRDWEAIASQVLPAKVVAHRPAPEAMLAAAEFPAPVDAAADCSATLGNQARIMMDGDWAEVSVPRCDGGRRGEDEFRLIHFEERWRFVYIDLFEERLSVTAER